MQFFFPVIYYIFIVATNIYMLSGVVTYCMMCTVSKTMEYVAQREYYFTKHVAPLAHVIYSLLAYRWLL